jgi:hypothetical protein
MSKLLLSHAKLLTRLNKSIGLTRSRHLLALNASQNTSHAIRVQNELTKRDYTSLTASSDALHTHGRLFSRMQLKNSPFLSFQSSLHTSVIRLQNQNEPPDDFNSNSSSSGGSNNNNNDDPSDSDLPPMGSPPPVPTMNALAPIQIPDFYPKVPIVAVSRNPLFPRFVKMLEITNKDLMDLIRRKVHLNVPFICIVMRTDDKYAFLKSSKYYFQKLYYSLKGR